MEQLRSFGADCYLWEPNPGKLGEHGRKGKWVGWDDMNISNRVYFPGAKGMPSSLRTGRHIAMKDSKLPTAVLKGKLGMVFPEYQPMDSDDSLDVDIPMDDEIAAAMETEEKDGGVTTITHQPIQQDGGVHNNSTKSKPQLSSNNETTNTFENTLGVKDNTTTEQDGGVTPVTTPKPPIDMELSDISDDDMMMMTDDPVDEVLPAARQELQVSIPKRRDNVDT